MEIYQCKVSAGILFLHDKCPLHRSQVAMATLRETGFHAIDYSPYNSDLVPSGYFPLKNLKSDLRGTRFEGEKETMVAEKGHFAAIGK